MSGRASDVVDQQPVFSVAKSESEFRLIVENTADGIVLIDRNGYILFSNPASEKLFGSQHEGLEGTFFGFPLGEDKFFEVDLPLRRGGPGTAEMRVSYAVWENEKCFVVIMRDITDRKRTEAELLRITENLKAALDGTIQALAKMVEARDPYTAGHQRRMADLAGEIAIELGMDVDRADFIRLAGSVHDIGKIVVPAEILSKPGKLSEVEFHLIKVHPQIGYDILREIDLPWPIEDVILQHHERMDGSGYPNGLKGDAIMLEARILAVADMVEAMISNRPYRPALGIEAAIEEMVMNRGIFYDPTVVDACIRLFKEKDYHPLEA